MEIYKYPSADKWEQLLKRPSFETKKLDTTVSAVLENIRARGDEAVKEYTRQFDNAILQDLELSSEEIQDAEKKVSDKIKESIDLAIKNITAFHHAQLPKPVELETVSGVVCWQKPIPISRVGLYIPGGKAPLFSTILMLAIPAIIAGCREIILCSPPGEDGKLNPVITYTALRVGITKIFKIGGIQAIGAMAYGTESVTKVDKIFGPGNQYVTAAKQIVSRDSVAIDMPAGPSEVAVIADCNSNPVYVASDLLSQAEHGTDSQVILFTDCEEMISKVSSEIQKQIEVLPKKEYVKQSLVHSRIFLLRSKDEIMEMVNEYAPEHLIISTVDSDDLATKVINAGSVFIGEYTPESAGDYASGTNHTLPTYGWAKSYSGVNIDSYFKKITYQKITKEGLQNIGPAIESMAEAEELIAHKQAVSLRLK
jgi:histidinol dehydrogenase